MKTHNLLITIIAACFILAGTSVKAQKASGNVVTRDITVADFSGINLSEPIDYLITQGDKNLLIIETDDNLFDQVKADVSNGILSIDTHSLGGASRLKVTIQVKELKNLNISGASNVKTTNTITSPELKIKASGAAEATLDLNVPQLTSELSGASNITLNGNATNHTLKASGASDLKADNLQTSTTNVTLSGACTVKLA